MGGKLGTRDGILFLSVAAAAAAAVALLLLTCSRFSLVFVQTTQWPNDCSDPNWLASSMVLGRFSLQVSGRKRVTTAPRLLMAPNISRGS